MSTPRTLIPVTVVIGAVALTSCGKTLDYAKIEAQIKEGITKDGGSSLKSVICPTDIKSQAGRTFECIGVLDSDAGFAIPVKQQDDQGNVIWDVTSVKGLLNMAKLQDEFAQGLKKEIGEARVDCSSGLYRAARPGETFECKLLRRDQKAAVKVIGTASEAKPTDAKPTDAKPTDAKPTDADSPKPGKKPKEDDFIQVTIQPTGDINWQRIIRVPAPQVAALPNAQKDSAQKDGPKPAAKTSTEAAGASPANAPAAKSADDFLNQPGAADDFD